jgi:AcrR family transcriptional regulator
VSASADEAGDKAAGYKRAAGSARGDARRRELLELVADDLAEHGLPEFSLRRAARSAGTTHKVLLYYFSSADDLLEQAIGLLRRRRIEKALTAAQPSQNQDPLSARVASVWRSVSAPESEVLQQAIGLATYDSKRYARLGREASQQYLPGLVSLCPAGWSESRKLEVASLILGALRGFLVERALGGEGDGALGLAALVRALQREEAAGE